MFDHLLESSQGDDSNKWSNIGFGEEMVIKKIRTQNMNFFWISGKCYLVYVGAVSDTKGYGVGIVGVISHRQALSIALQPRDTCNTQTQTLSPTI